jgi:hypothetical protein
MRPMTGWRRRRLGALAPAALMAMVGLGGGAAGCHCGGAGEGEPCDQSGDCRDGLVCDPTTRVCTVTIVSDAGGTDSALGTDSAPPGTDAGTDAGPGTAHDYVTDTLHLPLAGEVLGCDLDGNGTTDNALGDVLSGLMALVGMGFDPQFGIDTAIADGSLLMLWRLDDVNDFALDDNTPLTSVLGEDADADLMNNFGGAGTFNTRPGATTATLPGTLAAGALTAGPGAVPLDVPLGTGLGTLSVTLQNTCVTVATIDATSMMTGVMGGAVTQMEVNTTIVPAIVAFINGGVTAAQIGAAPTACVSDNTTIGDGTAAECTALDLDGICSASNGVDTGICVYGSDPIVSFVVNPSIDADGDGVVTAAELQPLLGIVLMPDLDLDQTGDPTACMSAPAPECPGVMDAFSLGVAFTAVGASILNL